MKISDRIPKYMTLKEIEKAKKELADKLAADLNEAAKNRDPAEPDKFMETKAGTSRGGHKMASILGNPDASVVMIQMVDDHDLAIIDSEVSEIRKLTDDDFCLIAIKAGDWNADLSPWKAPAVFGKEDFGGGAKRPLEEVLQYCGDRGKTYIIGGYSLAGLFALWAAYQTDVFTAVAAASPSMWFPGFVDYMKEHEIHSKAVYLSLGDKEEKARNPVMASVGACIREANSILMNNGIHTILEWNQGNHFKDADIRTAKAFAWARSVEKT